MASYKYSQYLRTSESAEFDKIYPPGTAAPYAGIFRCEACSHEIGIAEGHTLPPQGHAQHPAGTAIRWRLVVFAMHNT
jgi:hypothetical protein